MAINKQITLLTRLTHAVAKQIKPRTFIDSAAQITFLPSSDFYEQFMGNLLTVVLKTAALFKLASDKNIKLGKKSKT